MKRMKIRNILMMKCNESKNKKYIKKGDKMQEGKINDMK